MTCGCHWTCGQCGAHVPSAISRCLVCHEPAEATPAWCLEEYLRRLHTRGISQFSATVKRCTDGRLLLELQPSEGSGEGLVAWVEEDGVLPCEQEGLW